MRYVLAINGQPVAFPYTELQWRQDNPQVSMRRWSDVSDDVLAQWNVYPVTEQGKPAIDERTQTAEQLVDPVLVDGGWVHAWSVAQKEAAEVKDYDQRMRVRIKKEASRRILELAPEWKQRNVMARSLELLRKGEVNLTVPEKEEVAALDALWAEIKRIRAVSDTLEAMDPPPEDFVNDRHWTNR